MRQIKFRVFMGGKMLYPPFDFWMHDGEFYTELSGISIAHKDGETQQVSGHIMQATGCKDIDGNDVYEGDLLSFPNDTTETEYEVQWLEDEGAWGVMLKTGRVQVQMGKAGMSEVMKLTGNIYERSK